ncbi:uncharacterized protein G2W53_021229 [Senna tora]|uniref:Uncharacterized protein n=1 Tax=Senna tora TaxID=362788 RepID=A0A834WH07_9FABA|nr:uncharacterized protein G2W53_021229 [Senna tora]
MEEKAFVGNEIEMKDSSSVHARSQT